MLLRVLIALVGLLALLAILSCGEATPVSPDQATQEAQEAQMKEAEEATKEAVENCPNETEQASFDRVLVAMVGMTEAMESIGILSTQVSQSPFLIRENNWLREVRTTLRDFNALADEFSDDSIPPPVDGHTQRLADTVRAFIAFYEDGVEYKDAGSFDEATRYMNTIGGLAEPILDGIKNYCE